jgi:prevent-host-death family protein
LRTFSTVELTQQIGAVTDAAAREPVMITHHRKPRFVLMSMEDFEKMREGGRPRRAFGAGDAPPELAELLAAALERRVNDVSGEYKD